jgi:hypothetical protein
MAKHLRERSGTSSKTGRITENDFYEESGHDTI